MPTCGSVTVAADDSGGDGDTGDSLASNVSIRCPDLPSELRPGESTVLVPTVVNDNNVEVAVTFQAVTSGGTLLGEGGARVDPNGTADVRFEATFPMAEGDYTVTVDLIGVAPVPDVIPGSFTPTADSGATRSRTRGSTRTYGGYRGD